MRRPYSISKPSKGRRTYRYRLPGMTSYKSTGKTTRAEAERYVLAILNGEIDTDTEKTTAGDELKKKTVTGQRQLHHWTGRNPKQLLQSLRDCLQLSI